MPRGAVSSVVKSPYGFHIFKLEEKRPAGRRSLEEVSREIHDNLFLEKQERRHHQWLKELRARTKFEVNYQALEQ
jgi:parvulin-like peptidyl-prolyl isomerase